VRLGEHDILRALIERIDPSAALIQDKVGRTPARLARALCDKQYKMICDAFPAVILVAQVSVVKEEHPFYTVSLILPSGNVLCTRDVRWESQSDELLNYFENVMSRPEELRILLPKGSLLDFKKRFMEQIVHPPHRPRRRSSSE
jgi:hypothetical protein